ncbi:MAG: hypothetical protein AAF940_06430 [Pseudomonadota bacterium]
MSETSGAPEQLVLNMDLDASLARDDLVVSPSNMAAVHLIDTWPGWIAPVSLIIGPPGTGKTHLLAAWQSKSGAAAFAPDALDEAVTAARSGIAIAIDDVEQDAIDEVALFHLINTVREADACLLMTSRKALDPTAIKTPDLASRLRAATTIAIEEPDEALLRGVFAKLFADRQLAVDEGVIDYCLVRMPRSLQAVVDLVGDLDRASMARKRRITTRFAGEILESRPPNLPL